MVGFGLASSKTKGGAAFGLESGSLLFLALPLQWVAGALLVFFFSFYWVPRFLCPRLCSVTRIFLLMRYFVFDVLFSFFCYSMKIWAAKLEGPFLCNLHAAHRCLDSYSIFVYTCPACYSSTTEMSGI